MNNLFLKQIANTAMLLKKKPDKFTFFLTEPATQDQYVTLPFKFAPGQEWEIRCTHFNSDWLQPNFMGSQAPLDCRGPYAGQGIVIHNYGLVWASDIKPPIIEGQVIALDWAENSWHRCTKNGTVLTIHALFQGKDGSNNFTEVPLEQDREPILFGYIDSLGNVHINSRVRIEYFRAWSSHQHDDSTLLCDYRVVPKNMKLYGALTAAPENTFYDLKTDTYVPLGNPAGGKFTVGSFLNLQQRSIINLGIPIGSPADVDSITDFDKEFNVTSGSAIMFKTDGTKLWVHDGTNLKEYAMTIPFDVTSASGPTNRSVDTGTIHGMSIDPTGTHLYLAHEDTLDGVKYYQLSTPWSMTTATYQHNLASPGTVCQDTFISADGAYLFMVDNSTDLVYRYDLTTPFQISGESVAQSFDISTWTTNPTFLRFDTEGNRMYVGNGNNIIQFNMSTPFDLTTISYHATSPSTINNVSCEISPSGFLLYPLNSSGLIDTWALGAETNATGIKSFVKAKDLIVLGSDHALFVGSLDRYGNFDYKYIYNMSPDGEVHHLCYNKGKIVANVNRGDGSLNEVWTFDIDPVSGALTKLQTYDLAPHSSKGFLTMVCDPSYVYGGCDNTSGTDDTIVTLSINETDGAITLVDANNDRTTQVNALVATGFAVRSGDSGGSDTSSFYTEENGLLTYQTTMSNSRSIIHMLEFGGRIITVERDASNYDRLYCYEIDGQNLIQLAEVTFEHSFTTTCRAISMAAGHGDDFIYVAVNDSVISIEGIYVFQLQKDGYLQQVEFKKITAYEPGVIGACGDCLVEGNDAGVLTVYVPGIGNPEWYPDVT